MKLYRKKMEDYKKFVQENYVKDIFIENTVKRCGDAMAGEGNVRTSYYEFLYEQSKFIKKRWWMLQGAVLITLWLLLRDSGSAEYMGRIMGILASVFAILIIPEIWKNRKYSAVEIETTSFYSLRQICAARIVLFAIVDLIMVMVFFIITFSTIPIPVYNMIINFMLPFNVSGCICFRLLYSKWMESEYIAVFVSMVWIVVWSAIVTHDSIYQIIAEPVWIGFVILSSGYLVFLIQKSQLIGGNIWRDDIDGINV